MRKLIALAALALVAIVASCSTKNVGNGGPKFFSVDITAPATGAAMNGNDNVTFTVTYSPTGTGAPYNVTFDFGAGATPSTVTLNGEAGPTSSTTVMVHPGTLTLNVTATDANNTTANASKTFTVGPVLNLAPQVDSAVASADGKTLTVTVSDGDNGENLTVAITPPAGFNVDATSKAASATGPLTAVFNLSATDLFAGATGNFGVTVTDGKVPAPIAFAGGVNVTIAPLVIPADTLIATPLSASAATGATVTVIVATGNTANPFQYLVGCGLTVESDSDYVAGTNDFGAAGGGQNAVDGIWTSVGATGFLPVGDAFVTASDIGGGRERWDFNVTPLGGHNVANANGILFNVGFKFGTAGTKTFGFQAVQGVNRTYYSDDATNYFWGDITNDGTVAPNSVTIN